MVHGIGLGFRRDIADLIIEREEYRPAFIEVAPENWMGVGGYWGKKFRAVCERYPVTAHGLSLSIGSPDELDRGFLQSIKEFLNMYSVQLYTEHLSYSKCENAHLYDLLPIPFTYDAVRHVSQRIMEVQDVLERTIAIENVSYYTPVAPEMTEAEFVRAVLEESGCMLLLDVNNVYVNSVNHQYDPRSFISSLPLERVAYIHMAGHQRIEENFIIDTHGQPIAASVFELFSWTLERVKPVPVLLERDFDFSSPDEIFNEVAMLQKLSSAVWEKRYAA